MNDRDETRSEECRAEAVLSVIHTVSRLRQDGGTLWGMYGIRVSYGGKEAIDWIPDLLIRSLAMAPTSD